MTSRERACPCSKCRAARVATKQRDVLARSSDVKTLVTMTPEALRALAAQWFLAGFSHSGKGFHGETYDIKKHPALEGLLLSEFNRVYGGSND